MSFARLALVFNVFVCGSLSAQGQPGSGTIRGIVLDSLRNEALSGARITAQSGGLGVATSAHSDESGRFVLGPLTTGTYRLQVSHPILDSLGIALTADNVAVQAGLATTVAFGLPSVRTVRIMYCGESATGAFVVGRVLSGSSDNPVVGARIGLDWYQISADSVRGVVTDYNLREASSTRSGHFAFCNLPPEFEGSLSASADSLATPRVSFTAYTAVTLAPWLFVPSASAAPTVVSGNVITAMGPLPLATVEVLGFPMQAQTDSNGVFRLAVPAVGTTLVRAKKIGYVASILPVNITVDADVRVDFELEKPSTTLATVIVREKMSDVSVRSGFDKRARIGIGSYIHPVEIQKSRATCVVDLIRRHTGQVRRGGGCSAIFLAPSYRSTAAGIAIAVDAFFESPENGAIELGWLDARDVVGIEVYRELRGGVSVYIWTSAYTGTDRGVGRPDASRFLRR